MGNVPNFLGLLVVTLLVGCGVTTAQEVRQRSPTSQTPRYVAGELIVKFTPATGQVLEAALAEGRAPTQTGVAWLDELNDRYRVTAIAPVFRQAADVEEIARKFPERAKRAPPGADVPELRYIYTLTLHQDADLIQATADYTRRSEVEYAHPNYLATTQPAPPDAPR